MIHIVITAILSPGKALLYEHPGRKGQRKFVPVYKAFARNKVGDKFDFLVTRDSSTAVFGNLEDRYGEHGECPPSLEKPYIGFVRTDGPVGFRIQFFDPNYKDEMSVMSPSGIKRKHLQIHFGAAASHGCILVAGRRREYKKHFEKPLRALGLKEGIEIQITVESR